MSPDLVITATKGRPFSRANLRTFGYAFTSNCASAAPPRFAVKMKRRTPRRASVVNSLAGVNQDGPDYHSHFTLHWRPFGTYDFLRTMAAHNSLRKSGDCAMQGPHKEAARQLHKIAQSQQGFFTTKQAIRSGFTEKTHSYHVKAGNWIREHRGIYRLADFPTPERPDLMLWYLWSQNRQEVPEGTYSHDTALSLHELSDIMPSKLHMTVPKYFRRNSRIPEVLILHRADLSESDIEQMQGVRVTRPLRTVLDLIQTGHVDRNLIRQAIDEAMRRGLITGKQIESLPHDRLRDSFQELAGQHR